MRRILTLTASLAIGCLLAGCDRSLTEPTPTLAPAPSVTPNGTLPTALMVEGPASLAPGEKGAFKASARYADGSLRDVTQEAVWTSSDPLVVSMASGGEATGHANGEALVSFSLGDRKSERRPLLVLAPGTFMVSGNALDGDARILGAHIELLTQTGAPITTTTSNWEGRYQLYGVPDNATIRVTRDGFQAAVVAVATAAGTTVRRSLDLRLTRIGARPDYSGAYVLNVIASCGSGHPLPEALRQRRYNAVITQDSRAQLTVQLSGAEFPKFFPNSSVGTPGVIRGSASEDRARFILGDSWDWGVNPDVAEQLPNGTWLVIHGTAEVTVTQTGLAGTLNGSFDLYPAEGWFASMSCKSSSHQFVFTR